MSARTPPGRSRRATRANLVAGSSQWKAVALRTRKVRLARVPLLNVGVDDLDVGEGGQVAARHFRHVGAEVDRQDLAAPLGQRSRRLTCSAADLEDPWRSLRGVWEAIDDRIEDGRWIGRAGPVVEQRVLVEPRS